MRRSRWWVLLLGALLLLFFWGEACFVLPRSEPTGTCLVVPAGEQGALLYLARLGSWGEVRAIKERALPSAPEQEKLRAGEPAVAELLPKWSAESWCEVHPIFLSPEQSSHGARPSGVPDRHRPQPLSNDLARPRDLVAVTATDLGAPEADLPGGLRGRRMAVVSEREGSEYDVWDLSLIEPGGTETVMWERAWRGNYPQRCSIYRVEEGKPTWLFAAEFHRVAFCDPIVELVPGDGRRKREEILVFQPPLLAAAFSSDEWKYGRFVSWGMTGELAKRLPWMVVRSYWRWAIIVPLWVLFVLAVRWVLYVLIWSHTGGDGEGEEEDEGPTSQDTA